MSLPCTTLPGDEEAMDATLHLTVYSINGSSVSVEIALDDPPVEKDLWIAQGSVPFGDRSVHVEQGFQGMLRLRLEPPWPPYPLIRAKRHPPRASEEPPEAP